MYEKDEFIELAQIREIFERAVELDGGRAAFVRRECNGNDEIRNSVEQLLSADARNAASEETHAENASEETAKHLAAHRNRREVDGYQLDRVIGRGVSGVVYEASLHNTGARTTIRQSM
ncbi:MAG: hypothetical protein R3C03_11535 [Pirellulaceae bacterium]